MNIPITSSSDQQKAGALGDGRFLCTPVRRFRQSWYAFQVKFSLMGASQMRASMRLPPG